MRRKRTATILVLIICLMLTSSGMAMSSPNFAIDWMVPLSGGGSQSDSTHYAIHLTIGQTVIGQSASTGFQAGWGFWPGVPEPVWEVFLPLTRKQ